MWVMGWASKWEEKYNTKCAFYMFCPEIVQVLELQLKGNLLSRRTSMLSRSQHY